MMARDMTQAAVVDGVEQQEVELIVQVAVETWVKIFCKKVRYT